MRAEPGTSHPLIGHLFAGRFEVEARLGTGAMGNIYRARQVDMDRRVALKLLLPELSNDHEVVARFNRELRVTTQIEHPNTVRVYEYGQSPDGQLFLVMELLDGVPLSNAIAAGAPFGMDRIANITLQIAHALAAAHRQRIVHRDLKPENIMLLDRYGRKDYVKVLDFGLARSMEDDEGKTTLTLAGVRVGTPLYMAPEYVATYRFDHRSDLYALGMILYEMATGKAPFTGPPYSILEKQISGTIPPPTTLHPDVPAWLDELIMKLLARDPDLRPESAEEVAHIMERAWARLVSEPPGTLPGMTPERPPTPVWPIAAIGAAAFVLILSAFAVVAVVAAAVAAWFVAAM